MKLKEAVKKYTDNPSDFDYIYFSEATGIDKNDDVDTSDAIRAFSELTESYETLDKRCRKKQKKKINILPFLIIGAVLLSSLNND